MQRIPKQRGRILTTFVVVLLWSSSASAAVSEWPTQYLESGGGSCADPMSWVWVAPRAERIELSVESVGLCEIGTSGCDRVPESAPIEGVFDDVKTMCSLKSQHFEASGALGLFDNEACMKAERRTVIENTMAISLPEPPDPGPRGPSCSQTDSQCHSLPPIPVRLEIVSSGSGSGLAGLIEDDEQTEEKSRPVGRFVAPARGVTHRIFRPPIHH